MDEKLIIEVTRQVLASLLPAEEVAEQPTITLGVSARHLHLCKADADVLFGTDKPLTFKNELMGGQFAAEETVTIVSNKGRTIEKVRVIGPLRPISQVEISRTDAFALGMKPPVRESGDVEGAAPLTLIGPKGSVYIEEVCIIAKRHVHMTPEDAYRLGVFDKQMVDVKMGDERGGILSSVMVRVHPSFELQMHLDTDEANGMGIVCGSKGTIVNID